MRWLAPPEVLSQSSLPSGNKVHGHVTVAERSRFSVETLTSRSCLLKWPMQTIEVAELLARKMSVAAIDDPTYPNPFFVVDFHGSARCHYLWGTRSPETVAA